MSNAFGSIEASDLCDSRDGLKTVIPFRISGQAEVEYARLRWPDEAEPDIRFTLMDLPFDVESAPETARNTIVTIPVEASLAMDIAGNFLTRTASRSTELLGHLKASAYGYTSAVRRGTLLAEGRFKIQIIRGEGDMVRLRVMSAGTSTLRGHLGSASSASGRYTHFSGEPVGIKYAPSSVAWTVSTDESAMSEMSMIISRPSEKLHQTSFAGFLMPIHGPEGPNEPPGRIVRAHIGCCFGARPTHYGKG